MNKHIIEVGDLVRVVWTEDDYIDGEVCSKPNSFDGLGTWVISTAGGTFYIGQFRCIFKAEDES